MSRFHPDWDIAPILEAAKYWRDVALLSDGSVFGDSELWTNEHLDELQEYFVENLDYGEGNFMSKLEGQLQPTSSKAKQLMAELSWFMLLGPSNIGPDSKRDTIHEIWGWSGQAIPQDSRFLSDQVLRGIGSGGTAYNTQRWREVVFFIHFLRKFRALEIDQRHALLSDGWVLAEWIEGVPDADNRQLRHMLLYLLFPDNFDRIFGKSDRRKLIASFTDLPKSQIRAMSALEMSHQIQKIRKEQEDRYGQEDLDFYRSPLKEEWAAARVSPATKKKEKTAFDLWTASLTREHVLEALKEIDKDGIPQDARSSTYDLIQGSNRYPPKYVLSLAVKHAKGEEFPRSFFSGGEESRAFRLLRDKGFTIERKDFVRELLREFLKQADEASSLVVSSYPKRYRDLDINVSFGKGNFARIPWISYTGHRQTTSDGIYPVVLYFKAAGVLIVTYGISETNIPEAHWEGLSDVQTVTDFLNEHYQIEADRYGGSFVHKGFDLNEDVDYAGIERALDSVIGEFHQQLADQPASPGKVSTTSVKLEPYAREKALKDLFIEEEKFDEILQLLGEKKNLVLQGAPGVGKTFACKRIAYTLLGEKAPARVGMVQFHQSYSYEDFIQGYRPSGTGFRLKNGIFYDFCQSARDDASNDYVFIIDELNRGNLSKVFGELMMLIETDKRGPKWEIPLAYSEKDSPKFYIPSNLYLIGLMNTADRSLAMVDYALRRRFAFATLTPGFESDQFFDFMTDAGAEPEFTNKVVERMVILNRKIAEDTTNLGPGFCIGHSFFCSIPGGANPDWEWYQRIIKSEIAPLLNEYYFDAPQQAEALIRGLLH
jgi:5-methylcytosine-specific restriction protein B